MFKLAHLSDLHAGYHSRKATNEKGINLREADGYHALHAAITGIIEEEVDAVLITGDTFHVSTPSVRAILAVQHEVQRLWRVGIPCYILAGNHDTNDVQVDIAASKLLHDPSRRIYSFVEPYRKMEIGEGVFVHMISHHMYAQQEETMKKVAPEKDAINILATHGSCIDPILKIKLHTQMSPREIVIPDYLMDDHDWDYTLLGHIHERGYPGSKDGKTDSTKRKVYYNGSLLRRGFSDNECLLGRGWTLWTIDDDGIFTPTYHRVAQRPQQDFPIIDAADLSAHEVSQRIVEHLRSTQTKGMDFDPDTAPLLRQHIKNIDHSKYSALDWKSINANAKHALMWEPPKILTPAKAAKLEKEIDHNQTTLIRSMDVVSLYDDWVDKSAYLKGKDDEVKKIVQEQARKFVQLGQEATLND